MGDQIEDGLDTEAGTDASRVVGIVAAAGITIKAHALKDVRVVRIRGTLPPVARLAIKTLHEDIV